MVVAIEKLITSDILKTARYLGNEHLSVPKPSDQSIIRWVLTKPGIDEVGASNLGYVLLCDALNAQPYQLCDRAYLPEKDLATKLPTTKTPLFPVESQRWLTEFDILGIAETVNWLQREYGSVQGQKPLSFNLTSSNFTPEPHTLFQCYSVSTTEFRHKQHLVRQEFRRTKQIRVNFTDVRIPPLENFIGRGDRSLA